MKIGLDLAPINNIDTHLEQVEPPHSTTQIEIEQQEDDPMRLEVRTSPEDVSISSIRRQMLERAADDGVLVVRHRAAEGYQNHAIRRLASDEKKFN